MDGGNGFPTGTSHTVSDLAEGTAYSARVRARYHNSDGNVEQSGPWSTALEVTVASATLPAKPTGLSTNPSHDNVVLSWTNPSDNGITGYQVLRGPDAANLTVLTGDTGNAATSYTDSTVTAETTYVYATRARNTNGLGPQSDGVSAVTPAAPTPPAKPTGLSTTPSHDNVVLSWTDPGDSTITSYQVLRGPDADNLAVLTADTAARRAATTTTPLRPRRPTSTPPGRGTPTGSALSRTRFPRRPRRATVLPAKPTGLLTGSSHNTVLLFWTDPDDDTITGYQILRGLDADS